VVAACVVCWRQRKVESGIYNEDGRDGAASRCQAPLFQTLTTRSRASHWPPELLPSLAFCDLGVGRLRMIRNPLVIFAKIICCSPTLLLEDFDIGMEMDATIQSSRLCDPESSLLLPFDI
jgi:hypothetical protein